MAPPTTIPNPKLRSIPLPLLFRFVVFVLSVLFVSGALSSGSAPSTLVLPHGESAERVVAGASRCPSPNPSLYYYPVIGIVSHPGDGASGRLSNATAASNIPASYVKFVEAAGARVVPLLYNDPGETLLDKLSLVNGVLFTGGWAKKGQYFETIKKVFQIILDRNDGGDHFPLFAICLGFELVNMIVSKDVNICERFSAEDQPSTLQFTNYSVIQGSVFERFPPELLEKLSTDCLAMQNHKFGVSPQRLQENYALSSFFKVLTTSADENDKVYVSTAQAYNYPVTCFQWHPEIYRNNLSALINSCNLSQKNAFEWGLPMIPHSEDAVQVTQHAANYFIRFEARKSSNRPSAEKVLKNIIYNYSPTYCGKEGTGYDEVYIFSPHTGKSLSGLL